MKKYIPFSVSYQTFFILQEPLIEDTVFSYSLSKISKVKIVVYEVSGKMVKKIIDETQVQGEYKMMMNRYDLPVGMYYLKKSTKVLEHEYKNKNRILKPFFEIASFKNGDINYYRSIKNHENLQLR